MNTRNPIPLDVLKEAIRPHRIYHCGWRTAISSAFQLLATASRRECSNGTFWPLNALTMVGDIRLKALQTDISQLKCEGYVIECGVWRGGCLAWMRKCLDAYGQRHRLVIGFDTFSGFKRSHLKWADRPYGLRGLIQTALFYLSPSRAGYLSVSKSEVLNNLERLGILNQRGIALVEGPVERTLPHSRYSPIALARIDVDLYKPVKACLESLWPRLSTGGIIHIDDYYACPGCKRACDEYRKTHQREIFQNRIDSMAMRWTKINFENRPSIDG